MYGQRLHENVCFVTTVRYRSIADRLFHKVEEFFPIFSSHLKTSDYLLQGGYVIVVVCLFVSLFVSNFAQKLPKRICMKF